MARGIARVRGDTDIRALAARLFDLSGPDGEARARMAENALLRANPALRTRDGFSDGRVVVVPAIEVEVREEVERPAADLDGLLRETAGRLGQAASQATNALRISSKEAELALSRLGDDKFVADLIASAPEQGAKLVAEANDALKRQVEADTARQLRLKEALEAASTEIEALRKLADGGGKGDGDNSDRGDGGGRGDGGDGRG